MIAFQAASAPQSSAGASSATITWPGSPSGQMLLAVFGFENVLAASGPWVDHSESGGWERAFYQPPSADGGCGLEVWNTQGWSSGPTTKFDFVASEAYVAEGAVYTGQYTGAGDVVRASVSRQVTGDDPAAPSAYVFASELVIVAAADLLATPGYGTPTPAGWTKRFDNARGGAFGNVEITIADKLAATEGNTGDIPWSAVTSPAGAHGATATLAIRAAAAVIASTSPLLVVEYAIS
jgi:hypothetical protein